MLNVQTADAIVSTVTFILAYVTCATVAGALASWIIAALGDDTARSSGLTSFNPLIHIDPLGFLCFYLTGLGWFRQIPINIHHFSHRFHRLKIAAAFFAESSIHILFALISIMLLTAYFGTKIFIVTLPMLVRYEYLSHRILTAAYPELSSLVIVVAFLIISIIYVNTMLATLSILFNFCRSAIDAIATHTHFLRQYINFIRLLLPFAVIVIFAWPLRCMITQFICTVGFLFGKYMYPL